MPRKLGRAMRRHHTKRKKKNAERIIEVAWALDLSDPRYSEEDKQAIISKFAETPKPCSRKCCGNERRHFGKKTRQEIRADEAYRKK